MGKSKALGANSSVGFKPIDDDTRIPSILLFVVFNDIRVSFFRELSQGIFSKPLMWSTRTSVQKIPWEKTLKVDGCMCVNLMQSTKMSKVSEYDSCNVCGCLGHKSSRSQYCLARKENTFKAGSLVALSLPKLIEKNNLKLREIMCPGWTDMGYSTTIALACVFRSMEDCPGWKVTHSFKHEPVKGMKSRVNVNPARILRRKSNGTYKVSVSVNYYGWSSSSHHPKPKSQKLILTVPVFFGGKRLLFPLQTRRWELPKSMIAECRAYYNRGKADIIGMAKIPKFEDTSWRKGETAEDKMEKYKKSETYAKECLDNKVLLTKTCLLPDEIFREVMEFTYEKPNESVCV